MHNSQFQQGKLLPTYSIDNDILYFNGRFVLGTTSPLITLLLQEFHDTSSGGHTGITRTLVCLVANFFWPGMRQSVINYIYQCSIFQQIKSSTAVPAGLLQPLPIPEAVWEDVTMDFVTAHQFLVG